MGSGRDGGRDMYTEAPMRWVAPNPTTEAPEDRLASDPGVIDLDVPVADAGLDWAGYTVFQVKQKQTLSPHPQQDASWLQTEIRKELDAWAEASSGRHRTPKQLVFITNVGLTPVPDVGGHDQMRQILSRYRQSLVDDSRDVGEGSKSHRMAKLAHLDNIKAIRVWDRNNLTALLNAYGGVRRAFKALMTVPDLLADLAELSGNLPVDELEDGLRRHARSALMSDGRVYFAEAGGDTASVQVHDVVMDLPVMAAWGEKPDSPRQIRTSLVKFVLDRSDRVLQPGVTTIQLPRHLILTGDPGNGKSTITKFLTQVYRAAMLKGSSTLGTNHDEVVSGTETALRQVGSQLPRHRRWPFRIDLAEYAEERGHLIDDNFIRWIATKIDAQSTAGKVSPRAIQSWQREWPWFIVLDGLDEVTDPSVRTKVIERIVEFVSDAEADKYDLFVLLTTRPIGYTENILPRHFETVALADLDADEAIRYGAAVTSLRLRDDDERRVAVIKQLRDASESEAYRQLLRTPLQVLILTIIIDGSSGNLAPDRYSLFWGYYRTIFRREQAKRTSLKQLLRDHGPQITKLHERVGFELQRRSQDGDRSFAALSEGELKRVVREVLIEAGHKIDEVGDDLENRIFTAAMSRLVLIVPRGDGGFGFDVRSLQELAAARHIMDGEVSRTSRHLVAIAAHPHWRNTWIFAAGNVFASEQAHQIESLMSLLETLDRGAPERLGSIVPIGPRLALQLLDDGMSRAWPKFSNRLLAIGLLTLREPRPPDLAMIARSILRYADTGPTPRTAVADGLRSLLSESSTTRDTVQHLQDQEIPDAEVQVSVRKATLGLRAVRKDPKRNFSPDPVADWNAVEIEIQTAAIDSATADKVREIMQSLRTMRDSAGIRAAIEDERVAAAFEATLSHIIAGEPRIFSFLRDEVLPQIYRRPVNIIDFDN